MEQGRQVMETILSPPNHTQKQVDLYAREMALSFQLWRHLILLSRLNICSRTDRHCMPSSHDAATDL